MQYWPIAAKITANHTRSMAAEAEEPTRSGL